MKRIVLMLPWVVGLWIVAGGARAAVTQDAEGWTVVTPSADSRVIYVSNSVGDDAYTGLAPDPAGGNVGPKKTPTGGKGLLRDGYPDHVFFRRGDVWNTGLGSWSRFGRSASEPMVVGAYGAGPRPQFIVPVGGIGFSVTGSDGPNYLNHVYIMSLDIRSAAVGVPGRQNGFRLIRSGNDILIEDCRVQGFYSGLSFEMEGGGEYPGRLANVRLRRSQILDNHPYNGAGHSQGIFIHGAAGFLLEGNLIDSNGWHDVIPNAPATIFNHNVYVQNGNTGMVARENIFLNPSSHGIQMRSGGVAENNLFARNSIALLFGGGTNPEPGGVPAEARRNVVLEGKDQDSSNPNFWRGGSIELKNVREGIVEANVIANLWTAQQPTPLTYTEIPAGAAGLEVVNNVVYNWGGTVSIQGGASLTFTGNHVNNTRTNATLASFGASLPVTSAGNKFHSSNPSPQWLNKGGSMTVAQWKTAVGDTTSSAENVPYPEPGRTMAAYDAFMGGPGTYAHLQEMLREQYRGSWDTAYTAAAINDYIRAGFGVGLDDLSPASPKGFRSR